MIVDNIWSGKEKSKEKGPRRVSRCRMPAIQPRARRLLQRPKQMPAAQPERSARWWRPPRSLCLWGSQGQFPMRVRNIRETTQKEKKLKRPRSWKGTELVQVMWLKMEARFNHKGGRESVNSTTFSWFPWTPGQALKTPYGGRHIIKQITVQMC